MSAVDFLARVGKLSSAPSPRHPFGKRYAVLERAAILHFDAGMPVAEADAKAWDLEVTQGQMTIGGIE